MALEKLHDFFVLGIGGIGESIQPASSGVRRLTSLPRTDAFITPLRITQKPPPRER